MLSSCRDHEHNGTPFQLSSVAGGSPAQADLIHSAIRERADRSKIPVFSFAEEIGASGGCEAACMLACLGFSHLSYLRFTIYDVSLGRTSMDLLLNPTDRRHC